MRTPRSCGAVLLACWWIFAIIHNGKMPFGVVLMAAVGIWCAWEGFKIFREKRIQNEALPQTPPSIPGSTSEANHPRRCRTPVEAMRQMRYRVLRDREPAEMRRMSQNEKEACVARRIKPLMRPPRGLALTVKQAKCLSPTVIHN